MFWLFLLLVLLFCFAFLRILRETTSKNYTSWGSLSIQQRDIFSPAEAVTREAGWQWRGLVSSIVFASCWTRLQCQNAAQHRLFMAQRIVWINVQTAWHITRLLQGFYDHRGLQAISLWWEERRKGWRGKCGMRLPCRCRSGSKNVGLCFVFFNRRLLYCCTLNLLASLSSQPQRQATQYLCSTVKRIRQFYDYSSHTFVLSSVIDLIQLHHVRCYWPRLINRNPCIMSKHC